MAECSNVIVIPNTTGAVLAEVFFAHGMSTLEFPAEWKTAPLSVSFDSIVGWRVVGEDSDRAIPITLWSPIDDEAAVGIFAPGLGYETDESDPLSEDDFKEWGRYRLIKSEARRLRQLVRNLVENARDRGQADALMALIPPEARRGRGATVKILPLHIPDGHLTRIRDLLEAAAIYW